MRWKLVLISLLALLAVWVVQPIAAQDLTASSWYAVVKTNVGDELVWINGSGIQAALPRPKLPNEAEGSEGNRDLRISPDGRYAVITAPLNNGQQGLGIYDFQKGTFVKNHTAQRGESILLGSPNSFMPDSSAIAVGFYTVTDNKVTDWRIIQFIMATGDTRGVLQKSDQRVTEPSTASGSYPFVIFSPGIKQIFSYYFKMIPYGGNAGAYETLGWAPNGNTILPLGSVEPDFDVLPSTTHFIEPGYDAKQPATGFDGPGLNIIIHRASLTEPSETLVHDGSAALSSPRWANNGQWFAYHTLTPDEQTSWVVRTLDGETSYTYSGAIPSELYGTADGYLLNYQGKRIVASTQIDGSAAPVVYQAPRGDEARVIYVTPQDGAFAPTTIAGATTSPMQTSLCQGAPESQVDVNIPIRIVGQPLQVHLEPGINSPLITELDPETLFVLVEGPVCLDGFAWWRMRLAIPGGTLLGWVAEGNAESYFIEPV